MQRILIVRTSAIGDIVFASPMAAAIKRSWPRAQVTWLVESGLETLLAADPAVDRMLCWPKHEWLELWRTRRLASLARAVRDFRRSLRAERFDTVLDLQGLAKSGLLAWMSGAPRRIGLGGDEGSRWLMTGVVPKGGVDGRIGSEYADLAHRLGLDAGFFVPRLFTLSTAMDAARTLRRQAGAGERYAVLAPFTTRPQKHWREAAWGELATMLRAETDLMPVVLGGPGERAAATRICAGGRALDLTGRTSLAEAMALVAEAGLVVGVDTGLTHAGIGFARPTVGLFGSTCPYRDPGRANARVIWLGLACSPCRRRPGCDGSWDCMAAISPERVLDDVHEVLAAVSDHPLPPLVAIPRNSIPACWSPL